MPVIHIHMMEGRTDAQKEALMRNVTQTVVDTLGVQPQSVRILLEELQSGHFAVAGEPKYADPQDDTPTQGNGSNGHANTPKPAPAN